MAFKVVNDINQALNDVVKDSCDVIADSLAIGRSDYNWPSVEVLVHDGAGTIILQNVEIATTATFPAGAEMTGPVNISGDIIQTSGNSSFTGTVSVDGNINHTGNTTQIGDLSITGTTDLFGPVGITGDITQIGNSLLTGDTTRIGDLTQTGSVTLNGNLTQTGDVITTGNYNINGTTTQTGDINLTGNALVDGDVTVTGTIYGNATTASQLQTPRRIELIGDVEGFIYFDGSGDVVMDTDVLGGNGVDAVTLDGLDSTWFERRVIVSDTAPVSPVGEPAFVAGDLWWDSTDGLLKIRYQDVWVVASPANNSLVQGVGSGLDADQLDGQDGVYYTNYTDTAIANLVNTAPTTLDTLNELAAALGDDPNFATTISTQIGSLTTQIQNNDADITNLQTTKLDASAYTASDVLTKLLTVDGAGSGLNADLLDGHSSAYFQPASTAVTTSTTFGGDVSGTYNAIVVANDSHTHDGRYYTEAESDARFLRGNTSDTMAGNLTVNGTIYATGDVTAYSDARVKTNIEKIENAVDKVLQLNGYTFERIDKEDDGKRYAGVIAQEMLEVLPEVVNGGPTEEDPEAYYSVAYGNVVALLIESIKEMSGKMDAMQAEINQLRGEK